MKIDAARPKSGSSEQMQEPAERRGGRTRSRGKCSAVPAPAGEVGVNQHSHDAAAALGREASEGSGGQQSRGRVGCADGDDTLTRDQFNRQQSWRELSRLGVEGERDAGGNQAGVRFHQERCDASSRSP